jgi:hypothetical protein
MVEKSRASFHGDEFRRIDCRCVGCPSAKVFGGNESAGTQQHAATCGRTNFSGVSSTRRRPAIARTGQA